MLVKLPPTQTLDLSGKKYRLMFMAMHLQGGGGSNTINLSASQFNTYLTASSNTAGTVTGTFSELEMPAGLGSDLTSMADVVNAEAFTMSLAANGGATTITVGNSNSDHTVLEGFFNSDGSLGGVFTTGYVEAGGDRDELGLAVLIDVSQ